MAIQIGLDTVLEYNAGTDAAPSWIEVGFQVSGGLNIETNTVDTTTKSSAGWATFAATIGSWTMSVEGKLDRGDPGVRYLENAAAKRKEVHLRFRQKTGTTVRFEGKGVMEGWEYSFPVDDAATFSGSVKGNGAISILEP